MKSAIVTYLYPGAEKYLEKFIFNLNILNNDVTVYFFNDNSSVSKEDFYNLKLDYRLIQNEGEINETRHNSFQYLKKEDLDNIYFQDIDDLFSMNRFSVLNEKLKLYDLVCNDLDIIVAGKVFCKNYWGKRLDNKFEFDDVFIQTKNIVGLGNTGIKKYLLDENICFSNAPIAYDWYFFYQLIKKNKIKCLFTSECTTHYLQHEGNIVGAGEKPTKEKIIYVNKVKKLHYETLIKQGFLELNSCIQKLNNKIDFFSKMNYFWWEENL